MLYFKFIQSCTINEEFDFWGVKGGREGGEGCSDFKKSKKVSYITMVPTDIESFNILAQLESLYKL